MTEQAQRVALAEWAGWKLSDDMEYCPYGAVFKTSINYPDCRRPAFVKDGILCDANGLPNYPNDLNAVHELEEKVKRDEQWDDYIEGLDAIVNLNIRMSRKFENWCLAHATAPQRCEALLCTLGLWKEKTK